MRKEWFGGESVSPTVATSWSSRRLVASALLLSVSMLAIGSAVASLLTPGLANASPVATQIAGAVEFAKPEPATEIGDAVAARHEGSYVPAPTEHLTVVHVSASSCDTRSTGSGVVIADGLILTAAHVVGDAGLVRIDAGGVTVTGEVLGVLGDGRDVALISVDAPMAVPLRTGVVPGTGEPLTLVGHPGGGSKTVAVGGVVDLGPAITNRVAGEIVGIDVPVSVGMSGGPAVNADGDMVGLLVATETATDTALVVLLPDLISLDSGALVPGSCPESA
ncbi:MAG: S1-C subfamily serine protease [Candidatus Aldehydirespiratoraceae bacterium]